MSLFSPRYYGIRWLLGRNGIRENIAQELVPVVTPSSTSSLEGITNKRQAPYDAGEHYECTG